MALLLLLPLFHADDEFAYAAPVATAVVGHANPLLLRTGATVVPVTSLSS